LGLLVLAACGDESLRRRPAGETADAAAELADADALDAAGDAGAGRATDGAVAASDGRAASPSDARSDAAAVTPGDSGAAHASDAAVATPADAGPVTTPPSCKGGPVYFSDRDGDGFGDPATGACFERLNDVADSTDCYDHNAKAHPGAADFQYKDRGDGSFDYNCDGASEHKSDAFASCAFPSTPGWGNPEAPDCGVMAAWSNVEANPYVGSRCSTSSVIAQECR
jgi:hypothetical protein